MAVANLIASWSKDPSSQVGAVAIRRDTHAILATGFNGFPRGVKDLPEKYADRAAKYPRIVHAEANCIAHAARHNVSLEGAALYVTHPPCPDCAGLIINAGIQEVIHPPIDDDFKARWGEMLKVSEEMLREASVALRPVTS